MATAILPEDAVARGTTRRVARWAAKSSTFTTTTARADWRIARGVTSFADALERTTVRAP
jgi:hypothetical protein